MVYGFGFNESVRFWVPEGVRFCVEEGFRLNEEQEDLLGRDTLLGGSIERIERDVFYPCVRVRECVCECVSVSVTERAMEGGRDTRDIHREKTIYIEREIYSEREENERDRERARGGGRDINTNIYIYI